MMYNGREVLRHHEFTWDALKVGDLVEEDAIFALRDCVPPAYCGDTFFQSGEPVRFAIDEEARKYRPVYMTFEEISAGVWQFLGCCFLEDKTNRCAEREV